MSFGNGTMQGPFDGTVPEDLLRMLGLGGGAPASPAAPADVSRLFNAEPMGGQGGFKPEHAANPDVQALFMQRLMGPPQTFQSPDVPALGATAQMGEAPPLPPARPSAPARTATAAARPTGGPTPVTTDGAATQAANPEPVPSPQAQAAAPTQGAPTAASPSGAGVPFMDRFMKGISDNSDLLLGIGSGLMSTPGFGKGLAAGIENAQKFSNQASVRNLANAKFAIEQQKYNLGLAGQQQTAKMIMARNPGMNAADAFALASNPAYANGFVSGLPGGSDNPATLAARAAAGREPVAEAAARAGATSAAQREPIAEAAARAGAITKAQTDETRDDVVLQTVPGVGVVAINKTKIGSEDPAEQAQAHRVVVPLPGVRVWGQNGVEPPPGYAKNTPGYYAADNTPHVGLTSGTDMSRATKTAEGLDAQGVDMLRESRNKAQGAVETLDAIGRQKAAIDAGLISGAGADYVTKARSVAASLLGLDPSVVANSEQFDAAAAQKGAALAKQISQAGHTTNMDLQLGKTIAGGDRGKTEAAIRAIVDAQETLARDTITKHNKFIDKFGETIPESKDRLNIYRMDVPKVYNYGDRNLPRMDEGGTGPDTPRRSGVAPLDTTGRTDATDSPRPVVANPADAAKLPPGTVFETPDGRVLRVPTRRQ